MVYRAKLLRKDKSCPGLEPGAVVALKVSLWHDTRRKTDLERFLRQEDLGGSNDWLCPIHGVWVKGNRMWVAMEFSEGVSLGERIRTQSALGELPDKTAVEDLLLFFERAAKGLHDLHKGGLIHRDVKPSNLLVQPTGEPWVIDYGLLGLMPGSDGDSPTLSGDQLGTREFMSPEQVDGALKRFGPGTDVYGLAASLFQALTHETPFERWAANKNKLEEAIRFFELPAASEKNLAVSKEIDRVLACGLEKHPDFRYTSMLDFAEELERVRLGKPVLAKPIPRREKVRRWSKRNRAVSASLALLTFLTPLLFGLVLLLLISRNSLRESNSVLIESLEEVAWLKDRALLEDARAAERELWPLEEALPDAIDEYIETYTGLAERLPQHRSALQDLENRARPYADSEVESDRMNRAETVGALKALIEIVEEEQQQAAGEVQLAVIGRRLAELNSELARAQSTERISWSFYPVGPNARPWQEPGYFSWQHRVLSELVQELEAFVDPVNGVFAQLERRRKRAEELADAKPAPDVWGEARRRVEANERYLGLELKAVPGLLPLGPDPSSGWEEFLHLATHDFSTPFPERDAPGLLTPIDEGTGIVMVLIPMAADPATIAPIEAVSSSDVVLAEPEVSADDRADADPGSEFAILNAPRVKYFALAKHEMSRGQWRRIDDTPDPSKLNADTSYGFQPDDRNLLFPVESVSYWEAIAELRKAALQLPTLRQWSLVQAGNAGDLWSWGDPKRTHAHYENLADGTYLAAYGEDTEGLPIDGYAFLAPIHSFEPNDFGFHHMLGNVREWCRDAELPKALALHAFPPAVQRGIWAIVLGSSFNFLPAKALQVKSTRLEPNTVFYSIGIRPSMDWPTSDGFDR